MQAIRNILVSEKFDQPPAKRIEYDENETVIVAVPSDVKVGCMVEFCYYKRVTPRKKIVTCGSKYHQDNTYHIPVVARGVIFRKKGKLWVKDEEDKNYSLDREWNKVFIRDVIACPNNKAAD